MDFPDEVNLPSGPVKYTQSKTLLVRNIGNREAKFTLSVDKYVLVFYVENLISCLTIELAVVFVLYIDRVGNN